MSAEPHLDRRFPPNAMSPYRPRPVREIHAYIAQLEELVIRCSDPCPTCDRPNALTPKQAAAGWVCPHCSHEPK